MSTPEAPTNEPAIGEIRLSGLFAGRYQIIKELAKGGMGVVYKAHDNVLDKVVALKLILYSNWSEDQLLRFQREAQASSRLLHPNIAVVYNFGLDENSTPYMVLEYVEGKRSGGLSISEGSKFFRHLRSGNNFAQPYTMRISTDWCTGTSRAAMSSWMNRSSHLLQK
jgi:Serine/threonine protein kinase